MHPRQLLDAIYRSMLGADVAGDHDRFAALFQEGLQQLEAGFKRQAFCDHFAQWIHEAAAAAQGAVPPPIGCCELDPVLHLDGRSWPTHSGARQALADIFAVEALWELRWMDDPREARHLPLHHSRRHPGQSPGTVNPYPHPSDQNDPDDLAKTRLNAVDYLAAYGQARGEEVPAYVLGVARSALQASRHPTLLWESLASSQSWLAQACPPRLPADTTPSGVIRKPGR